MFGHETQGWKHLRLFFGRVNPGVLQIRNIFQILLWKKYVPYHFCQQYTLISKFHDFVVSSIAGKQMRKQTVFNLQNRNAWDVGVGCKLRILQSCLEIVQVKVTLVVFSGWMLTFWVSLQSNRKCLHRICRRVWEELKIPNSLKLKRTFTEPFKKLKSILLHLSRFTTHLINKTRQEMWTSIQKSPNSL